MILKTILTVLIITNLAACTTTLSSRASSVITADNSMVLDCKFLGETQGSSGWGNIAASQGMQNARNEAQEKAAELGATHIVWITISGGYSPFAVGRAYQCN